MVIQPMSVSDQILAVINDLCAKFGIAIDWTAENVLPYIEDLCARYIQYEVQTSIAWCVIMLGVTLIAGITWGISAIVDAHTCSSVADFIKGTATLCFWVLLVISVFVCADQIFDIIACNTVPEKVIIEYIEGLINSSSSR